MLGIGTGLRSRCEEWCARAAVIAEIEVRFFSQRLILGGIARCGAADIRDDQLERAQK